MEPEAENWRLCSATLVRGVFGELDPKVVVISIAFLRPQNT